MTTATPNEATFLATLSAKTLKAEAARAIASHNDEAFWLVNNEIARRARIARAARKAAR